MVFSAMRKSKYPIEARTFGEKIRKKRMDLKLDLKEVAGKVGISEGYLSRIEADKQVPKPDLAKKIALTLKEDPLSYVRESTNRSIVNFIHDTLTTTSASTSISIDSLMESGPLSHFKIQKKK